MRGKYVKVIDRLTNDAAGNGDYVDLYSNVVPVDVSYNVNANSINGIHCGE